MTGLLRNLQTSKQSYSARLWKTMATQQMMLQVTLACLWLLASSNKDLLCQGILTAFLRTKHMQTKHFASVKEQFGF